MEAFSQVIPQFLTPLNPYQILHGQKTQLNRTKKICTLGPKTSTVQSILSLIDNGVNVARLNFSHGDHQSHFEFLNVIREALKQRSQKSMAILLDTKGPEIRTGKNKDGSLVSVKKGQILQLTTDYSFLGTNERISCSYKSLSKSVKIGNKILIADGTISSSVTQIDLNNNIVKIQIQNDGIIGQKKNMCLPGCEVDLPTINDYDQNDILNFGVKHKVDYIALSFTRFKKDLDYVRKIIGQKDSQYVKKVQLISKIENHQALQNIQEIIQASDGIMIARGDLGMETPLQSIVLIQKFITSKTIQMGKFVIVATQMLDSMQKKPRPSRAQVSDVTNAILDYNDAIMTSGETANGQFYIDTVQYMRKISSSTQILCDYRKAFQFRKTNFKSLNSDVLKLVQLSFQKNVDFIVLKTDDINLVRHVSNLRPVAFIIVISNKVGFKEETALNFGVYVINTEKGHSHIDVADSIKVMFKIKEKIVALIAQKKGENFQCHLNTI